MNRLSIRFGLMATLLFACPPWAVAVNAVGEKRIAEFPLHPGRRSVVERNIRAHGARQRL